MTKVEKIWRAMQIDPKTAIVTAVPFLIDPYEGGEEPEVNSRGEVPMVQFVFSDADFEIIKLLQQKQTAKAGAFDIDQMFLEKRIADLLSKMIGEYADFDDSKTHYQLPQWFKVEAEGLLT